MKKILILSLTIITVLLSQSTNLEDLKKERIAKQLKIEMEKEKKYSIEQTFYNHHNYDYKGSEVNKESLEHIPDLELDDLDMDSVYD